MGVKKKCTKCKEEKSLELFAKSNQRKDGLSSWCKACKVSAATIAINKNKEHYSNYKKIYNQTHKDSELEIRRHRHYHIKRKYGISIDEYELMLVHQNNKCLICAKDQTKEQQAFAVDHCHKTGKIRGLLCCSCNRGIGYLKDSIQNLHSAIQYLEKYEKES